LKANAAGFTNGTLVPIAFGATHVQLNGVGIRGGVAVPLVFFQVPRGDLTSVIDERYAGPFPSIGTPGQDGRPIPLIDNVQWIVVTSAVGFAGNDVLFEVEYYQGA
ncbi:MAG: hypothetical protein ACYDH4_11370, partial [Candidatus Cryosericum sp.]